MRLLLIHLLKGAKTRGRVRLLLIHLLKGAKTRGLAAWALSRFHLPDDDCSGLTRRQEVRPLQHRAPEGWPKLMRLR